MSLGVTASVMLIVATSTGVTWAKPLRGTTTPKTPKIRHKLIFKVITAIGLSAHPYKGGFVTYEYKTVSINDARVQATCTKCGYGYTTSQVIKKK